MQYVPIPKTISYEKRRNIILPELPLAQVQTFLILNTNLLKIKVLEDDPLELLLFDLGSFKQTSFPEQRQKSLIIKLDMAKLKAIGWQ